MGYYNHVLYLGNTEPNSPISIGLYHSLDEGISWNQSRLEGIFSDVIQMTAHPAIARQVAAGTEDGLYLSDDFGHAFASIDTRAPATVAYFTPDGESLIYGFRRLHILAEESSRIIRTPDLSEKDHFAFVAVNPANEMEIVVVTNELNIYISSDLGGHWKSILKSGRP